jgi:hypothetical protein
LTTTQIANALGVAIIGGAFTAAADLGPRGAFAVGLLIALGLATMTGLPADARSTHHDLVEGGSRGGGAGRPSEKLRASETPSAHAQQACAKHGFMRTDAREGPSGGAYGGF